MNEDSPACSSNCVSPFQLCILLLGPLSMLLVLAHLHAPITCCTTVLLFAIQMHSSHAHTIHGLSLEIVLREMVMVLLLR